MSEYEFSVEYFLEILPEIASHLDVTLKLTLIATLFSLLIGCLLAVICYYRIRGLYFLARFYISLMRSTPLVAQLYLFYYGLAKVCMVVMKMDAMTATALVMSLNMGAFMAETIRGAMLSVDSGQREAARALGMTDMQTTLHIILPQAVPVALPALFNDFINLIKLSALSFMVGVKDIMGAAKAEGALSFRFFEVYVAVMLIYWALVSFFGVFQKRLEKYCMNMF